MNTWGLISWGFIAMNLQFQIVNFALSDVQCATLAVGRGDLKEAHRLSRRARRLRRFGWPTSRLLPQGERLHW